MVERKATQAHVPSVKMVAGPKVPQADHNQAGSAPRVDSRPVARLSALLPDNDPRAMGSSAHQAGTAAVRRAAAVGVVRRNNVRRAVAIARRAVAAAAVGVARHVAVEMEEARRAVAAAVARRVAVAAVVARRAAVAAAGSVVQTTATGVPVPAPVAVGLEAAAGSAAVQTVVRLPVGSAVQ